jgi:hypothetical protein
MIVSCVVDEAVGTLAGAAVSNGTCTGLVAKRLAKWFRVASPFVEVRGETGASLREVWISSRAAAPVALLG